MNINTYWEYNSVIRGYNYDSLKVPTKDSDSSVEDYLMKP